MPEEFLLIKKTFARFLFAAILILTAISCSTVRPYQRAYLNDEAMQAGKRPSEKFIGSVHSYREAAMGGGRGKTSGGCGCN